jgi:hypothetical protein
MSGTLGAMVGSVIKIRRNLTGIVMQISFDADMSMAVLYRLFIMVKHQHTIMLS